MATHFSGPVTSTNGFVGAVTGGVSGAVVGSQTGLHYDAAAPTAYAAGAAEVIDPAIAVAALTKTAPAGTWTLAAPGATNINKFITVYQTVAIANVVAVTGLLGGTTMTFAAAIGASFTLYAVSAAAWAVVTKNGVTQS